jgi:glycosyltransferase involved in cell wall biosynthesis
MFGFLQGNSYKNPGVDVVGYLSSQNGVGQAGRLLISALSSVNYPITTFDVKRASGSHRSWPDNPRKFTSDRIMMAIDAHSFVSTLKEVPKFSRRRKYVIAQWFWELEKVPAYFRDVMQMVDELWVPSNYMYENFLAVAPQNVDVRHMPLPLEISGSDTVFQRNLFASDDQFVFLFIFDFLSVMKRKNPLGAIEAFCNAFREGEGPLLVIKTMNSNLRPRELEVLKSKIDQRKDIKLLEQSMTTDEVQSLISACNAYVSLHRSEGLGLTLAEAMSLGKPVIATSYSGNLDFMNSENSILIPWTRVKVGPGAEGYDSDSTWAEPNLEVCITQMRNLVSSPELCERIGTKAKKSIAASNASLFGKFVKYLLNFSLASFAQASA